MDSGLAPLARPGMTTSHSPGSKSSTRGVALCGALRAAAVLLPVSSDVAAVVRSARAHGRSKFAGCADSSTKFAPSVRSMNGSLRYRCKHKECGKDFTITSGTLFASHKLPLRSYLLAVAIFCNEVKGKSMLALSRDLGTSYKCTFMLAHKLREAMASELKGRVIGGEDKEAEVDSAYFGGYVRLWRLGHNTGRAQDRVVAQRGLERRGRKVRGNAEKAEREHKTERTAAQQHRGDDCDDRRAGRRPDRRLMLGGKIKHDAGAERDGKPRQQPPGADLDGRPFAYAHRDRKLGLRPSSAPRLARFINWPGSCASSRARPQARRVVVAVSHRAPPPVRAPSPGMMLARRQRVC